MIPDDQLDTLLLSFRDSHIPDGPPPEIVSRTLADLRRDAPKPSHSPLYEKIRTMPPIVRIAAAVLFVAGTTGILNLTTWGQKGPGIAFANAVEHVRAARTIRYTMRIGDDPTPFRVSRME